MGLDISHDAFSGSYGTFGRWRSAIAKAAGIPLVIMEGYYDKSDNNHSMDALVKTLHVLGSPSADWLQGVANCTPLKWSLFSDPVCVLLNHSDCDGIIEVSQLEALANRLEELALLLDDDYLKATTVRFIRGARNATSLNEPLEFH